MRNQKQRVLSLLLALSLLLSLAACGGDTAASMHLRRTEGTVSVSDGGGKDVPVLDNLGLYSGYRVDTRTESYAWIDLDDVKLAKMDQDSEIAIQKDGKHLEIEVKAGSLFFNVTKPLADDETMNIRTSTMLVGIRGTCGWVEENDGLSRLYLLEGKVECAAGEQTVLVSAGEMAELTEDGKLTVTPFKASDVTVFVVDEVAAADGLAQAILNASGLDVLNPDDPVADALEQYRIIISQADSYVYDEYAAGTEETSYRYALVQMQPEDAVPTLLIEQLSISFFGSYGYTRVFQYDPEGETVRQPDEILMEGTASAGGYRGSLAMMGDGNGIQEMSWSSGTGEAAMERVTLEGDSLQRTRAWEGRIDLVPDDMTAIGIDWHDITDPGGLDGWTAGTNTPADRPGTTQPPETARPSAPAALPTDGNRIVFTGTINSYTYDGVLALQGIADPNPGSSAYFPGYAFRLIVLDTPQEMNLKSGDGLSFRNGTVSIINVSYASGLEQYDGQHLVFSIDPGRTQWPSGTDLPLGEPGTSDVHVLFIKE